ncbi:winged helix-turn-helix transcriptional regulator [Vagococcus sp. BWB3-3]|uniref:Winged helix-turn-helix transcriptional regulator n=1 Tax=Vagococcus allomyrinae TaxID=2794353 RepID=A0A940PE63_9ENTE|nr:MarR family winged helix-turn-helix transcriptional regulator [Vagococcus allomyrinae]MBP1042947.1 winged helix-turn-helix transcriptional regulator [Vagococcus allomyrinae]
MAEKESEFPVSEETIDHQFRQLNHRHNNIYQFVMLYYNYIISKHDYGTGDLISMIEAHTITFIEENPGTTVSELATYWRKTKGAISQTVSKLIEKGFVKREQASYSGKTFLLYVTDEGLKLSKAHKLYDTIDIAKTLDQLLEKCSVDEIEAFFKVIKEYIVLIENDFD